MILIFSGSFGGMLSYQTKTFNMTFVFYNLDMFSEARLLRSLGSEGMAVEMLCLSTSV